MSNEYDVFRKLWLGGFNPHTYTTHVDTAFKKGEMMSDPNRAAEKAAKLAARQTAHQQAIAGLEFKEWPKIGRLNRDIVITEKIDGTNAAIGIIEETKELHEGPLTTTRVYAQSRSRIITPSDDNYGFAAWVERHKDVFADTLGPGLHFGEWWGVSIARGYGLSERRFSLFNTSKWGDGLGALALANARLNGVAIYAVPVLYSGPWTGTFGYTDAAASAEKGESVWLDMQAQQDWSEAEGPNPRPRFAPNFIMEFLKRVGSQAAPGFMEPEGIVVYHHASNICMKATIENDAAHKFENLYTRPGRIISVNGQTDQTSEQAPAPDSLPS